MSDSKFKKKKKLKTGYLKSEPLMRESETYPLMLKYTLFPGDTPQMNNEAPLIITCVYSNNWS